MGIDSDVPSKVKELIVPFSELLLYVDELIDRSGLIFLRQLRGFNMKLPVNLRVLFEVADEGRLKMFFVVLLCNEL